MILAQTERLHNALDAAPKVVPRQNMKDRHKAVEYKNNEEIYFNMPSNPPMPESVALRSVPSLSFLCSCVISQQRASLEEVAFMSDITTLPDCPEWTGYNTKKARDAGILPGPIAKVFLSH